MNSIKKFGLSLSLAAAFVFSFPAAGSAGALYSTSSAYPGRSLEKIVVVDYANAKAEAGAARSTGGYKLSGFKLDPANNSCYLNTSSPAGAFDAINTAANEWDEEVDANIFSNVYFSKTAKYGVPDGVNCIEFSRYPGSSSVIAVTAYWIDRRTKTIVEFDMLYNTYYTWGDAKNDSEVMDIQNIATHEFGHAFGLLDIYNSTYSDVTMYGYSDYGEITKRDLADPDKAGIHKIYGQ
jgi:hypothetical protein